MAKRRSNATTIALDWKAIHKVADARIATVRRLLVEALNAARDSVTDDEIASTWLYSPEGMRRAVDWRLVARILGAPDGSYVVYKAQTAADVFGSLYVEGGTIAGGAFGGRLDLTVPEAIAYGERRAGALITGLQAQQVDIVRDHLGSALRDGIEPARLGRMLRSTTGLSPRQARSLENYERGLYEKYLTGRTSIPLRGIGRPLADQRFSLTRLDEERIGTLVDRYRDRLVNYRAEMIARTETMRAANMGAFDEWRAAGEAGLFDVATAQRVWIATPDDRSCDNCLSLDGEVIGFEEEFVVPGADPDDESSALAADMPPLHPMCRCSTALEVSTESMNNAFGSEEFAEFDDPEGETVPDVVPEAVPEEIPVDVTPDVPSVPVDVPDALPTISPYGERGIDPRTVVEYDTPAAMKRYGRIVDEIAEIHGIDPVLSTGAEYSLSVEGRLARLRAQATGVEPAAEPLKTVIVKGGKTEHLGGWFGPQGAKTGRGSTRRLDPRPRIRSNVSTAWGPNSDLSTFIHEFGHRVDAVYTGTGRQYAYASEKMLAERVPEAVRFAEAVQQSTGFAEGLAHLRTIRATPDYQRYFASTREVWARAYNQWAAYRVRDTLPDVYEAFVESTRRTPYYQWTEEEFVRDIAPAVEGLLRARGLLR